MLKKILIGLVIFGTIAVLIIGGVNRTIAKTSQEYGTGGRSARSTNTRAEVSKQLDERPLAENVGENGAGKGRSARSGNVVNLSPHTDLSPNGVVEPRGAGQGYRGGNGRQTEPGGEQLVRTESQGKELVTLQGSFSRVEPAEEVVMDVESGQIVLEGRSLSYAVSQGFSAQVGEVVSLTGFYEGENFEIVELINHTTQQTIRLREPGGRPLWAGGRRAG